MKRITLFAIAATVTLGGTSPLYAQSASQILKGTAIGAGGGALVGAVVPGVSTGDGALIGAAGGAAYTALTKNRHYYRDRNGNRYYVRHGRRVYR